MNGTKFNDYAFDGTFETGMPTAKFEQPGLWTADLTGAQEYAAKHHGFYIVIMTNVWGGCGVCNSLNRSIYGTARFQDFFRENEFPLVVCDSTNMFARQYEDNWCAGQTQESIDRYKECIEGLAKGDALFATLKSGSYGLPVVAILKNEGTGDNKAQRAAFVGYPWTGFTYRNGDMPGSDVNRKGFSQDDFLMDTDGSAKNFADGYTGDYLLPLMWFYDRPVAVTERRIVGYSNTAAFSTTSLCNEVRTVRAAGAENFLLDGTSIQVSLSQVARSIVHRNGNVFTEGCQFHWAKVEGAVDGKTYEIAFPKLEDSGGVLRACVFEGDEGFRDISYSYARICAAADCVFDVRAGEPCRFRHVSRSGEGAFWVCFTRKDYPLNEIADLRLRFTWTVQAVGDVLDERGEEGEDDEGRQATQPDQKVQYDIPRFDPADEDIPDAGGAAFEKSEFPLYHTYASEGRKYVRASSNISALNLNGEDYNGIRTQLRAAYLNKRITEVSPSCFANCSALTAINADNNVKAVGDYAFYGCASLKGVSFLGERNKELRRIGDYAFARSGLRSVKVNLVGSVDDSAMHSHCFASCDSLEQAEFTNSTYLGDHQFDGCRKLQRVFLNDYHSYVSEYCFANCTALRKIDLPAKTYMISPHMFDGCANLTAVNFAEGADLRQLGDAAFSGCSKLTSLTLPESVSSLSFIDPNFLSGSSVSRVVFRGIDDEYLCDETKHSKEISYSFGKIYVTDLLNLMRCAQENSIPVVAWLTKGYGYKCDHCNNFHDNVLRQLSGWFGSTQYFYAAGEYVDHNSEYLALENFLKGARLDTPGTWIYLYLYWKKEDGTFVKWTSGSINPDASYAETFRNKILESFSGYSGPQQEIKYKIKESITTFGRGEGLSVTYVSKTGNEYVCSNDSIEHVPETKVDKETVDDFRYGIWYYNAREMKQYADEHGLPALFEYSSTACDPCRDFRKSTFDSQEFQSEIKKRPCLFSRVEIGEGEYFDHPTTTQAYYVSHTLNKENTYIPCLVYYWKKPDGSVYQRAWNYNYRTDPANANYETVLAKLDSMLGDYSGDDRYWPPDVTWSNNGKFQYYENENGDENGRYFACDRKKQVSTYSGELDIDLEIREGGEPVGMAGAAWRRPLGAAVRRLEVDEAAAIPDYTYQYFTTTGSDAQYNVRGVIFKVESGVVSYIFEFMNENAEIPDSDGSGYSAGKSYAVESATGFGQIVEMCREQSIPLVVLESPVAETEFDKAVKSSSGFRKWLKRSPYVMAEVRTDDWGSALGVAVRQFESETAFHGNSASDPLPKLLVYHGCSSCTADGSLAVYCRRKIAVEAAKDYSYYTSLLDMYAEEYEM